jgi:hypothetical protein
MTRTISYFVALAISGIYISGCSHIPYKDAFPSHFADSSAPKAGGELKDFLVQQGIIAKTSDKPAPADAMATLPPDFQIASMTGYLICVLDADGGVNVPFWSSLGHSTTQRQFAYTRTQWYSNSGNSRRAHDRFMALGYRKYSPIGFPDVTFFMPQIDYDVAMDEGYGVDWAIYLEKWVNAANSIRQLLVKNDELRGAIVSDQALSDDLTRRITLADVQVAQINGFADNVEAEAKTLEQRIAEVAQGRMFALAVGMLRKPYVNVVYDPKTDFLLNAVEKNLENVSSKPWAGAQAKNPYLDSETAQALDKANAIFANPDKEAPDIAADIKATGIKSISIASGARTPLNQMAQKNPDAAKAFDSNHAIGIATDIAMKGTPFDVSAQNPSPANLATYNTVKAVLAKAGLVAPVPFGTASERNHFELNKYSSTNPHADRKGLNDKRIKMFKEYEKAAKEEYEKQKSDYAYASETQNNLVNSRGILLGQLEVKSKQLQDRQQKLEAAQRRLDDLNQRRARDADELNRRIQERQRRQNSNPRDGRGPVDRSSPAPSGAGAGGGDNHGGDHAAGGGDNHGGDHGGGSIEVIHGGPMN